MKKRIMISLIIVVFLAVASTIVLIATRPKPVKLSEKNIRIEYNTTVYDGTEKQPTIRVYVKNKEVSTSEYNVKYENNVNAGVANVKITSVKGSDLIEGETTVKFEIERASVQVSSIQEMHPYFTDSNYNEVILNNALIITSGQSLTIPEGYILTIGSKVVTNNGTIVNNGEINTNSLIIGNGAFTNNGEYIVNVSTAAELNSATLKATKIVLLNDIGEYQTRYQIQANATNGDVDLEIDLNSYSLVYMVYIQVSDNKKMNLTIKNGTIYSDDDYYAIYLTGSAANIGDVIVNLEDINAFSNKSGIQSNASDEKMIVRAKNCSFGIADGTQYGFDSTNSGAYLPADYEYNFENCSFVGKNGYDVKGGTHNIITCNISGIKSEYEEPKYITNGWHLSGSGLIIDFCQGYKDIKGVNVVGGSISSQKGFAIEQVETYEDVESKKEYNNILTITSTTLLNAAEGKDAQAILIDTTGNKLNATNIASLQINFENLVAGYTGTVSGNYSISQLSAIMSSDVEFYVEVGEVLNGVNVHSLIIGNNSYTVNSNFEYDVLNSDITIKDKVFYVKNGKLYIALSVVQDEIIEANLQSININGKNFVLA